MITITVQRRIKNSKCVTGLFKVVSSDVEGIVKGYTLEPPDLGNRDRVSCIPAGEYKAYIRDRKTSKWDYDVIQLEDVPDREAIQIHIGNYPKDTLGCILVGSSQGKNTVWRSGDKYRELMSFIRKEIEATGKEEICVIIKDVAA